MIPKEIKNQTEKRFYLLALTPFLFYSIVLMWTAKSLSFLSDDWHLVYNDSTSVSDCFTKGWSGLSGKGGYYRPLVKLSLVVERALWGNQPALFHETNIVLHILVSLLIFLLARELFSGERRSLPLLAMYLFFVLPIHTDNVFWIVARTDVLCALFFILATVFFSRFISRSTTISFVGTVLCFLGGILSKEMALTLPGIFIIVATYKRRLFTKQTMFILGVLLALYVAYFYIRVSVLGTVFGGNTANTNFSLYKIGYLYRKAFLLMFLDRSTITNKLMSLVIPFLTGLLALILIRKKDFRRDFLFLIVLLFVSMIPLAGLVVRWYLYIPSAFACLIVARIVSESLNRGRMMRTVAAVLAALLVLSGGVSLYREGLRWEEASALSEGMLGELASIFKDKDLSGEIFLVNVPSAYFPSDAIGEKPIFAYFIEQALESRLPLGLNRRPIVVNHLWLEKSGTGISTITKIDPEHFLIQCDNRAHFSFHTEDFVSGRLKPENITIRNWWGEMQIIDNRRLVIAFNSRALRTIVFFGGSSWKIIAG